MDIILQVILAVAILWLLYLILKELRTIRIWLELPSEKKKSYDDELNEIDKKMKFAIMRVLVSSKESGTSDKQEWNKLVAQREKILNRRREQLYKKPEYLK